MIKIKCDKCKKDILLEEFNDSELILAKKGEKIMCDECEKGWIVEKNKMEKEYKEDVLKERNKYINKPK